MRVTQRYPDINRVQAQRLLREMAESDLRFENMSPIDREPLEQYLRNHPFSTFAMLIVEQLRDGWLTLRSCIGF